jgi:gliding motility associated protien GldN
MKRYLIFFILLLLGLIFSFKSGKTQTTLEGVYLKERVANRRPVPYQYVRESDVMWSKIIWRKIDLREKMNQILYFPEQPIGKRRSLISLMLWAIDTQGLQAYDPSDPNYEFKRPITREEINERFGARQTVKMIEDVETGQLIETIVKEDPNPAEVREYIVKELWFFDKQRSVMEVRILGICPVRIYYRDEDIERLEPLKTKLFWVYFPQARKVFAENEVYNPYNDAERMSFDDLFFKRFFSSYVVKESNTYENRQIEDYAVGIEAMLESERIKNEIMNFEHELWEF